MISQDIPRNAFALALGVIDNLPHTKPPRRPLKNDKIVNKICCNKIFVLD